MGYRASRHRSVLFGSCKPGMPQRPVASRIVELPLETDQVQQLEDGPHAETCHPLLQAEAMQVNAVLVAAKSTILVGGEVETGSTEKYAGSRCNWVGSPQTIQGRTCLCRVRVDDVSVAYQCQILTERRAIHHPNCDWTSDLKRLATDHGNWSTAT